MKKTLSLLLALTAALALSACGTAPAQPSTQPTEAPAATGTPAAAETPEATEAPAPEKTPLELAEECVGKDVAELYAAIGDPLSADYAPSCLGDGEDGILRYDGFSVYTYRENGSERVDTVLAD